MQQKKINMLAGSRDADLSENSSLSFRPFLTFLRDRLQNKDSPKKEVLEFVLHKFESFEKIDEDIKPDELPKYKELLNLLYVVLTNLSEDEKQIYWGLSIPMTSTMFYGSDLLYKLFEDASTDVIEHGLEDKDYLLFINARLDFFYGYILKHFYNIEPTRKSSIVRNIKDTQTKLTRHFSINLNTTFVEVKPKFTLPEIDVEIIRSYTLSENSLSLIQEILPLDMFLFKGFTIITITDVTQQYALDTIRNNIVKNQAYEGSYGFPDIVQALKELTGSNVLEFNILPLFKVNGKLAKDMETYNRSMLFSSAQKTKLPNQICFFMIEQFLLSPEIFYYEDLGIENTSHHDAVKILLEEGIKSYTILPIFFNKKLVGAVEAFSKEKGLVNTQMLSRIESAKELLAQLMYNSLAALEVEIENIIKDKYTRLQPSVEWKFTETAWRYLQGKNNTDAQTNLQLEEIGFKEVYPLYGAIDIRNSTIERNAALLKDHSIQFEVLIAVLKALKEKTSFGLIDEKIFKANKWAHSIKLYDQQFNKEAKLNDFLEHDMLPFLVSFTDHKPELQAIAASYFEAIDEKQGIAFENRRKLESSMTKVISAVNNYFDQLKDEIQMGYPCYFEKFRTDGVEYDIYIGQSISPGIPYNDIYLKNLRLLQLTSMAIITNLTHALLPQLSNPIETTQLIFIHTQPIDILFRNDEKRFDVEGAYNIRYHIIKKRIDKVHLKDADERLTQPGKIAMVYFSEKEASEYISYIKYLQSDNILHDDLEKLELEELSGVSGLKALRVGVNMVKNLV